MLAVEINEVTSIALFEPQGALSADDFKAAVNIIDPWVEKNGELKGLIIHTREFPGWESFAALISHLNFVKEHHKKITRVALVTDSKVVGFAEKMAKHFLAAEIELFSYEDIEKAMLWITG